MSPEDQIRILHMIEAAQTGLDFVADRGRSDFENDLVLVFAVTRAIEIMGGSGFKSISRDACCVSRRAVAPDHSYAQSSNSCLFRY